VDALQEHSRAMLMATLPVPPLDVKDDEDDVTVA
jgi:hypothetical protein